jgi:hypothetical protein
LLLLRVVSCRSAVKGFPLAKAKEEGGGEAPIKKAWGHGNLTDKEAERARRTMAPIHKTTTRLLYYWQRQQRQ